MNRYFPNNHNGAKIHQPYLCASQLHVQLSLKVKPHEFRVVTCACSLPNIFTFCLNTSIYGNHWGILNLKYKLAVSCSRGFKIANVSNRLKYSMFLPQYYKGLDEATFVVTIDIQFGIIVCLFHSDETKLSITTDSVASAKRAWKNTAGSQRVYEGGAYRHSNNLKTGRLIETNCICFMAYLALGVTIFW